MGAAAVGAVAAASPLAGALGSWKAADRRFHWRRRAPRIIEKCKFLVMKTCFFIDAFIFWARVFRL